MPMNKHWGKYYGIIRFHGGTIFVKFVSTSHPQINILHK